MSTKSTNLDLDILGQSDPADLMTVSNNFQKIDAVAGDIATVETSPTTAAHAKGEFIIFEGRLYKVTAAIASGAALVLGTNVSAANVGSEIKALQDSVGRVDHMPLASFSESNDLDDIHAWIMKPNVSCANRPSGLSSNNCMVLSFATSTAEYNAQIAFSFGADKIAIRRRSGSTTWTNWKYFTAS